MNTADPGGPRGRILVVEDDPEAALYAVHVLSRMGHFDVAHTPDPAVALQRATSEQWDLVLTDLDMPGMTGLELLAELRQAVPALPVAVITAHVISSGTAEELRKSADAFLEKPVPPDRLVAVAATLIAGRRGRQSDEGGRQSDEGGRQSDEDRSPSV
jgi:CheY-like chemotaxis protein